MAGLSSYWRAVMNIQEIMFGQIMHMPIYVKMFIWVMILIDLILFFEAKDKDNGYTRPQSKARDGIWGIMYLLAGCSLFGLFVRVLCLGIKDKQIEKQIIKYTLLDKIIIIIVVFIIYVIMGVFRL